MLKKYSSSTAQTCGESSVRGMGHQQSHMFSSLSPEARVRRIIRGCLSSYSFLGSSSEPWVEMGAATGAVVTEACGLASILGADSGF